MSSSLSCGPPPPAAIYPDISTAFAAIQAHAEDNGYAFIARDRKPTRALYLCDRAGNYYNKGKKAGVNDTLDFLESHEISDDDEEEVAGVAGVFESQLTDTDAPLQLIRS